VTQRGPASGLPSRPMSRHSRRRWALAGLLGAAGALALTACSSSPSNSSNASSVSGSTSTTRITTPAGGALVAIGPIATADRSPAGTFGTAPTVTVPSGAPPAHLESADLITGTGAPAEPGDSVTVQYVLATYSTGKVVQSSWTSQPYTFTLGEGMVIPGWDKGVVGMKQGGRRELIIPPADGYGSQSPGPGIAANDTLVFVIDLLKVVHS
jgi:peptidylprolyl isomerase